MTRRPEHRPHATGAHRAHRGAPREARAPRDNQTAQPGYEAGTEARAAREPDPVSGPGTADAPGPHATLAQQPPLKYDPHLDGLFTYCLSVLCEHDAATAALGEVLALAEKRADRAPADDDLRRPWLYALARWACLRRLVASGAAAGEAPAPPDPRRRAELALLAWPEAAGTTAEQREALELAVRHGLTASEVAAVLGLETDAARALLSSAACEVERTRTALAVVEAGRCPVVARFAGDTRVLLGAALRRELVRHVDDCADCRRTAERATAGEPWPGTAASSAPLPVLEAPRADAYAAMLTAAGAGGRQRGAHAPAVPRFDRRGYPVDPKDRTARRGRLRSRAVTTTVVVTVVAAPVLALWAAWHGAPETGESHPEAAAVSSKETGGVSERPYRGPGPAPRPVGSTGTAPGRLVTEVSVAVTGPDGRPVPPPRAGSAPPSPAGAAAGLPAPGGPAAPGDPAPGPGRLTVSAQPSGTATIVTLTASGGRAVVWSMTADAPWLRLSKPGGVLQPGQTTTVVVEVDAEREPTGPWRARVVIAPGGTTVTIEGRGRPVVSTPAATQSPTAPPSPTTPSPSAAG
ncbi:sigma-70 family RNA polymerase sigma factor [Streptomyces sp. VNUA116]|uniref:BACON domain-containing protein n=2 Tax=Actinomycetes TaxID=1760 RepID=UPI002675FAC7|nr:sigma-70 family RNA polymerase sigma factor [Streptomyces sp. VNUA116]WKU46252.1 sigma-70 family RNA polymerase sigma factor [Streptomyces sp. VNUA116]